MTPYEQLLELDCFREMFDNADVCGRPGGNHFSITQRGPEGDRVEFFITLQSVTVLGEFYGDAIYRIKRSKIKNATVDTLANACHAYPPSTPPKTPDGTASRMVMFHWVALEAVMKKVNI